MPTPYLTLAVLQDSFGATHIDKLIAETKIDVDKFLDSVNAQVDSYVGVVVALPPLESAVDIVRGSAADIARFRLMRAGGGEDVRSRFEDAIRFLERVSAGKQLLPSAVPDPAVPEPASLRGLIEGGSATRQMQRHNLRGW